MDLGYKAGPLVGRDAELEQLEEMLDALDRATPGCLAVEGEPGIGKTRLLGALREGARGRGHIVLAGAAAEFEQEVPFSVFVDALDAHVASHGLSERGAWDEELEREVGQLLPSVRPSAAVAALPDERYRSHRAMRRLLALIADERPLVLVLDDLHWCDAASVELIAALVRRPPAAPVLVALGFRPGRTAARLAPALARPSVVRVELGELTRGEAAAVLGDAGADAVDAIYRYAGGNPFYLEQLHRSRDATALPPAPGGGRIGSVGVPPAVAAAIAEELAVLPKPVRRFLDGAAVAGDPFEPGLAAAIAEVPEGDGLAALDELLACDLVRQTAVPRRFRFRHPLVRRAVYGSAPGGWRLAAHARAAAALAASGADAAERAHHVEESARTGDEKAIEVLLAAGRAAAARAPAAAVRWYEAALRLLPADAGVRQIDVLVALASARRSLGELEACRTTLIDAMERAGPEASMRRVELTALCAAVEHWQGRHDEAHRRLVRAWEGLTARDTPEAAALQVEVAVDAMYRNDFDLTIEMGAEALATARALNDGSLIAVAASALALGEVASGRVEAGRAHRAEAVAVIDRMDDLELAARLETLYYLGWAETYLEHYDDAIGHAERGIAIARATGEGRLLLPLMLLRCYPYEMQGRLAEVNRLCETAVEIARQSANRHFLFWALFELSWARYFAGDLDGAIASGEESVAVGGRTTGGAMPSAGGGAGWTLAVARHELGDHAAAREQMREVGGEDMRNWTPVERWFNWENVVLVEIALGNLDAATAVARQAEAAADGVPLRLPAALVARMWAAVRLATGDAASAADAARASIAAAEPIGAALQVACSRSLLGQALAAAGDRTAAVEALREAERELSACGSVRMRDEARRALRRLGARAEPRGPATPEDSGVASLTARETEISDLITERLTNREIAGRLFLSEKTVESHVRNVFHKLGASSRVEVARIIERDRRKRGATAERA